MLTRKIERVTTASFGGTEARENRRCYCVGPSSCTNHALTPLTRSVTRFDKLVDFLQRKIETTILGKNNRARSHRNYETFDEFQLNQQGN